MAAALKTAMRFLRTIWIASGGPFSASIRRAVIVQMGNMAYLPKTRFATVQALKHCPRYMHMAFEIQTASLGVAPVKCLLRTLGRLLLSQYTRFYQVTIMAGRYGKVP